VAAVRRWFTSGSAAASSEVFWIKARREEFIGGAGEGGGELRVEANGDSSLAESLQVPSVSPIDSAPIVSFRPIILGRS
jgi:hypothetical protein